MARREGLGINNQFRVMIGLPLDSRERVDNLTDLTTPSTWYADDNDATYLWKGMRTYVKNADSWYELIAEPTEAWTGHTGQYNYENPDNWKVVSGGGGSAEGHIYDATKDSLAEGTNLTKGELNGATGIRSHAEGSGSKANGNSSHAEGVGARTLGDGSHAEGFRTVTGTTGSHAEGYQTVAYGNQSHTEGCETITGQCLTVLASIDRGNNKVIFNESVPNKNWRGIIITSPYGYGSGYYNIDTIESSDDDGGDYEYLTTVENMDEQLVSGGVGIITLLSSDGGSNAHAEGSNTTASGIASHAEGSGTIGVGTCSHAEGFETGATGEYSHAEGLSTKATGHASHAEGSNTEAFGESSHVEGLSTKATGEFSHAEGRTTHAQGKQSHAEGSHTDASGIAAHAEGLSTKAYGEGSHAEGLYSGATGEGSHAEGISIASGSYSHAEGISINDKQIGTASFVSETNTKFTFTGVSGATTPSVGDVISINGNIRKVVSVDENQIKIDRSVSNTSGTIYVNTIKTTTASGIASHAEGSGSKASGVGSHTEGSSTETTGSYSHAEGSITKASGFASHAEGSWSKANGNSSHAEGVNCGAGTVITSKSYSTSDSAENSSTGYCSHAEGLSSYTTGAASHAEGWTVSANKRGSHAEGYFSTSDAPCAHAEGHSTHSDGKGSHAEGVWTTASNLGSHAEGMVVPDEMIQEFVIDHLTASGSNIFPVDPSIVPWNKFHIGDVVIVSTDPFDINNFYVVNINDFRVHDGQTDGLGCDMELKDLDLSTTWYVYTTKHNTASGVGAHAEGGNTDAAGHYSHAEGIGTIGVGTCSHAEGYETGATGEFSHAEGCSTKAIGHASHAEGLYSEAAGEGASARGISKASGLYSTAEGSSCEGNNIGTADFGDSHITFTFIKKTGATDPSVGNLIMFGVISSYSNTGHIRKIVSINGNQITIDHELEHTTTGDITTPNWEIYLLKNLTEATGIGSHAEGCSSQAVGLCSHAEGRETIASGNNSHAEGHLTKATGLGSHAEGLYSKATGLGSHTEGQSTEASGQGSHAEGINTAVYDAASHAEGCYNTITIGCYGSHAEGCWTKTSDFAAHAEGHTTHSSGKGTHTEGIWTTASNFAAHAEGMVVPDELVYEIDHISNDGRFIYPVDFSTVSWEKFSVGDVVIVSTSPFDIDNFFVAHVEGLYEEKQGQETINKSIMILSRESEDLDSGTTWYVYTTKHNTASGVGAHAEGGNTDAAGHYSHAGGKGTVADCECMTAIGRYNVTGVTGALVVLGNGTGPTSGDRKTVLSIVDSQGTSGNSIDITIDGKANASGGFFQTSDLRKKNIVGEIDLDKAYELIDKCQTVLYTLKTDDKVQLGMIAQEVRDYFPEIVLENGSGELSLDYAKLTVVILRVLKDLISRINRLENSQK